MNKKLKLITCLIAGIMGTTAYGENTESKVEDNKKNIQMTSSLNKSAKSSSNLKSSELQSTALYESTTTAPTTSSQQMIKAATTTIKGLNINNGKLSYTKDLYSTKANFGRSKFDLSLVFYQDAPASYNGGFSGQGSGLHNQHPFGISAYMINYSGEVVGKYHGKELSNEKDSNDNGEDTYYYFDKSQNTGAIWGFNLPAMYISTSNPSKYYNDDNKTLRTLTLDLGGKTYNFIVDIDFHQENGDKPQDVDNDFIKNLLTDLCANGQKAIYSKEGKKLVFEQVTYDDKGIIPYGISVTTPEGTKYFFEFQKYMGGDFINEFDPFAYYDGHHGTRLPGTFIFQIKKVMDPTGSSINYSYNIDDGGSRALPNDGYDETFALQQITVTDDYNNILAQVKNNLNLEEPSKINTVVSGSINGKLTPLYQIYYQTIDDVHYYHPGDGGSGYHMPGILMPRVTQINDLLTPENQFNYSYTATDGGSNPGEPGNMSFLSTITSSRSTSNGASSSTVAEIEYIPLVQERQDAGGNNGNSYDHLVSKVRYLNTNWSNTNPMSETTFDYTPRGRDFSTIMAPYLKEVDGQYFYGTGYDAWLDNVFFLQNKDPNHTFNGRSTCTLTYDINKLTTIYSNPDNTTDFLEKIATNSTYDALQRIVSIEKSVQLPGQSDFVKVSSVSYDYDIKATDVGSDPTTTYKTYESLPIKFNRPNTVTKSEYVASIAGQIVKLATPISIIEEYTYDDAGKVTDKKAYGPSLSDDKYINDNDLLSHQTFSYLPASETYPMQYERLLKQSTTYSKDLSEFTTKNYNYIEFSNENIIDKTESENPIDKYSVVSSTNSSSITDVGSQPLNLFTSSYNYNDSENEILHGGLTSKTSIFNKTNTSPSQTITTSNNTDVSNSSNDEILIKSTKSAGGLILKSGSTLLNSEGITLEDINATGQITDYYYDNKGRLSKKSKLVDTNEEQSAQKYYNLSEDLALDPLAVYSTSVIDIHGNKIISLQDWRGKKISNFKQLVNDDKPIKISSNKYDKLGRLIQSTSYTTGSPTSINYYYNSLGERVASVPEIGLATGIIHDTVNKNTIKFNYEPNVNNPTKINKIYGNVVIVQINKLNKLPRFMSIFTPSIFNQDLANVDLRALTYDQTEVVTLNSDSNDIFYQDTISNKKLNTNHSNITLLAELYTHLSEKVDGINFLNLSKVTYDNWFRVKTKTVQFANPSTREIVTHTTKYSYSDDGSQSSVTLPNGNIITIYKNQLGKVLKTTLTVDGKTTILNETEYNALGIPTSSTTINAENKVTFSYDDNWQLISSTNAKGITTQIERDSATNKIINRTTGNYSIDLSYDQFGRLISSIDQDGNKIENTYLSNGLLDTHSTTYAGDKTYTWKYNYNEFDKVTSIFNPFLKSNDGTSGDLISYEYDKYGRLIGQSTNNGNTESISYDNSIFPTLITSVVINSQEANKATTTIDYTYNDLGQLTKRAFTTNDMKSPNVVEYNYDINGVLTEENIYTGYTKANSFSYWYDDYGRLSQVSQYQYLEDGIIAPISDYLGNTLVEKTYKYDNYNNIVEMTNSKIDLSAPEGYRLYATRAYNYNDGNNPFRLTSIDNIVNGEESSGSLTYNELGDVIQSYDGTVFTYNDLEKVSSIQKPNNSQAETYEYGPTGKIIHNNNPLTSINSTTYYSGSSVIARSSVNSKTDITTTRVNTPYGQQIQSNDVTSQQINFTGRGGSVLATYTDKDATTGKITPNFNLEKLSGYTPYGVESQIVNNNHDGYPKNIQNEKQNTVYGYRGQLTDSNTGYQLLGNGTRLYDPVLGRFLQSDPAESGLNWYAYANNNPVMASDPTGLSSVTIGHHTYHYSHAISWAKKQAGEMASVGGKNKYANAFVQGLMSGISFGAWAMAEEAVSGNYSQMGWNAALMIGGPYTAVAQLIYSGVKGKTSPSQIMTDSFTLYTNGPVGIMAGQAGTAVYDLSTGKYQQAGMIATGLAGGLLTLGLTMGEGANVMDIVYMDVVQPIAEADITTENPIREKLDDDFSDEHSSSSEHSTDDSSSEHSADDSSSEHSDNEPPAEENSGPGMSLLFGIKKGAVMKADIYDADFETALYSEMSNMDFSQEGNLLNIGQHRILEIKAREGLPYTVDFTPVETPKTAISSSEGVYKVFRRNRDFDYDKLTFIRKASPEEVATVMQKLTLEDPYVPRYNYYKINGANCRSGMKILMQPG